jgi:hypothetical protein
MPVENVGKGTCGETAGSQSHARRHVYPNPQPPGELIVEIGDSPEAKKESRRSEY